MLDLSPHQVKQAGTQKTAADGAVTARLPETYQWLLVPGQDTPQAPIQWQAIRLTGQDALAVRASKKLKSADLLVTSYGATLLRMELDRVPLWRGDHVGIRQLIEDFARYLYLPRLREPGVLLDAITAGLGLLTWEVDSFAYAESYDEDAQRHRGLRHFQQIVVGADDAGLLVKSEVVCRQLDAEKPAVPSSKGASPGTPTPPAETHKPKRFHGTVVLETARAGHDAGRIADEVITHLAGLIGASVRVTLEIEAYIPEGVPDHVVRIVTENSRTLKFENHGFESE